MARLLAPTASERVGGLVFYWPLLLLAGTQLCLELGCLGSESGHLSAHFRNFCGLGRGGEDALHGNLSIGVVAHPSHVYMHHHH
nr:hypothetical protein BaRGS_011369 [Batillaria attramentaria]